MITSAEIREVGFSRQHKGYAMSEVDDILEKAAVAIEQLQAENGELVGKLEVLAERIQEYRSEEDSIRSALLTAQKSADKILKEANEEKVRITQDAETQAAATVQLAEEKAKAIANETREKISSALTEAKEKAASLLKDAKEKSDSMLADTMADCVEEKKYLAFLKEQEESFRQSIIDMYRGQFELLKKGPEAVRKLEDSLSKVQEPASITAPTASQEETNEEAEEEPIPDLVQETADSVVENPQNSFVDPDEIPLPFAEAIHMDSEETVDDDKEETAFSGGFSVNRKFGEIKFGDDYDISSDDNYDFAEEEDS